MRYIKNLLLSGILILTFTQKIHASLGSSYWAGKAISQFEQEGPGQQQHAGTSSAPWTGLRFKKYRDAKAAGKEISFAEAERQARKEWFEKMHRVDPAEQGHKLLKR